MESTNAARAVSALLLTALVVGLSACGGGGSGGDGSPPPAVIPPVPATVTVSAPKEGEVGNKLAFSNSASGVTGLSFAWNFGDGNSSTEANPQYTFTKGGEFEVVLTVRNAAGDSRVVRQGVSIANRKLVKDRECSGGAASGWCWMNPLPTGNAVRQVLFRTTTEAWSVGLNGEIFKTVDGGATWSRRASGVSVDLNRIVFSDAKHGWILGDDKTLLSTRDGGETWTAKRLSDAVPQVEGLYAEGERLLVLGFSAMALTNDAGATWQVGGFDSFTAQIAPDLSAWFMFAGRVERSTDGGRTRTVLKALPFQMSAADRLLLLDSKRAVLTRHERVQGPAPVPADGPNYDGFLRLTTVWTTVDSGKTWSAGARGASERTDKIPELDVAWMASDGKTLYAMRGTNVLRSADAGVTWAEASPKKSPYRAEAIERLNADTMVLHYDDSSWLSTDGGTSWAAMLHPEGKRDTSLKNVQLRRFGATSLMASGSGGKRFVTDDLGKTWRALPDSRPTFSGLEQTDVSFVGAERGWMIDDTGGLRRSVDGGRTWAVQATRFSTFSKLQMLDGSNGWVLDFNGSLYRTTDGGTVWQKQALGDQSLRSVRFETSKLGWARNNQGKTISTRDAGASWVVMNGLDSAVDLDLSRTETWVAVGTTGVVYTSSDEGKSWQQTRAGTGTLTRVRWVDAQTLVAVSDAGAILRSGDRGKTWQRVSIGSGTGLSDLVFADALNGWAVGDEGVVMVTRDGGKSWRQQKQVTRNRLLRVQAADAKTAWISGMGGTLLATGTGGD
jgi:photosystem II stability/assembly factor-like uncharacterized protein